MNTYLMILVCFLQQLLSLGLVLTFPAYLKSIQEDFHLSSGNASALLALCTGIIRIGAIFSTAILQTFNYRKVLVWTGLISTISLILIAITKNFVVFVLIFGIVYGFCNSITFTATSAIPTAILPPNLRRFAIGIIFTGSGLSVIIFPPFHIEVLLKYLP